MKIEDVANMNMEDLARMQMSDVVESDSFFMGLSMGGVLLALLFSFIGFLYFRYGRSSNDFTTMMTGILLMLFPYVVTDSMHICLVGLAIMGGHFYLKRDRVG